MTTVYVGIDLADEFCYKLNGHYPPLFFYQKHFSGNFFCQIHFKTRIIDLHYGMLVASLSTTFHEKLASF